METGGEKERERRALFPLGGSDELRLISFEDSWPDTTKKEARECEGGIYKEGEAIGADPTSLDAGCLQPPKEQEA